MKVINISQNKQVLVDDEDFEKLNTHKWFYHNLGYAVGHINNTQTKKRQTILMHRLILQAKKGQCCDHINGNKLDNRKVNLRLCTNAENSRNLNKRKSNTSGYKGVRWATPNKKWLARIKFNYKYIYLGYFLTREEAAMAYNEAAKKYFGKFAKLNNI